MNIVQRYVLCFKIAEEVEDLQEYFLKKFYTVEIFTVPVAIYCCD